MKSPAHGLLPTTTDSTTLRLHDPRLRSHVHPRPRPHLRRRPRRRRNSEDPTTGELTLRFTDGTRAVCDLLVGADGIRSVTRGVMYRRLVQDGVVRLPGPASPSAGASVDVDVGGHEGGHDKSVTGGEISSSNGIANGTTEEKGKKEKEEEEASHQPSPPPSPPPRTPLDPVADFIDPVWSGTLVYRALIPKAVLDATWPGHRVCEGPVCVSLFLFHVLCFFFRLSWFQGYRRKTDRCICVLT